MTVQFMRLAVFSAATGAMLSCLFAFPAQAAESESPERNLQTS